MEKMVSLVKGFTTNPLKTFIVSIDWLIVSPEMKEIGIGDVKDDRLTKSIQIVSQTFGLPRTPTADEIFDRSFLPAKADRMAKK